MPLHTFGKVTDKGIRNEREYVEVETWTVNADGTEVGSAQRKVPRAPVGVARTLMRVVSDLGYVLDAENLEPARGPMNNVSRGCAEGHCPYAGSVRVSLTQYVYFLFSSD